MDGKKGGGEVRNDVEEKWENNRGQRWETLFFRKKEREKEKEKKKEGGRKKMEKWLTVSFFYIFFEEKGKKWKMKFTSRVRMEEDASWWLKHEQHWDGMRTERERETDREREREREVERTRSEEEDSGGGVS